MTGRILFDVSGEEAARTAWRATAHGGPPPAVTRLEPGRMPGMDELTGGAGSLLWWDAGADAFVHQAGRLLRELIHPLAHRPADVWLALPFGPDALAPRALTLASASLLDAEDIGSLLGAAGTPPVGGSDPAPAPSARRGTADSRSGRAAAAARPDPVAELDEVQRRAALHHAGPLRVLAPAGSGKTKTMVSRIAALVEHGVPAADILALAFNTKAAEQLEDRLAGLSVPTTRHMTDPTGVHCATFNAFGYRYLREVLRTSPSIGAGPAAEERLVRTALWEEIAPGAAASIGPPPADGRLSASLDDLTWRAVDLLAAVRADCRPPESLSLPLPAALRFGTAVGARLSFAPVLGRIRAAERGRHTVSFDDQIHTCVLDLLARPAARQALQRQYRYLLVDEFQDLNAAQLALVDILSRPHRNLFVVGDDDQLIYGWRFARVATILGFPASMPATPHASTEILTTNYRCSREIVERASQLIAHNRSRVAKTVRCAPTAAAGSVTFVAAADWPSRAAAMAAFLADQRTVGGGRWAELCVLCRYRCQQPLAAAALTAAGIPCALPTTASLAGSPAAALLGDCLRLVAAPAVTAPEVGRLARSLRLQPASLLRRAAGLRRWSSAERPVACEFLDALLDELPIEAAAERLGRGPRTGPAGGDAADAVRVVETARLLSLDHDSLASFAASWAALAAAGRPAASPRPDGEQPREAVEADAVVISTIHAAKGREYDAVAVLDYNVDLGELDTGQVEEERRVLYVALTRARRDVLLTVDTARWTPHPFLRELARVPSVDEVHTLRRDLAASTRLLGACRNRTAESPEEQRRLATLRLRRLYLSGRLTEHRLFRPRPRWQRLLRAAEPSDR